MLQLNTRQHPQDSRICTGQKENKNDQGFWPEWLEGSTTVYGDEESQ